MRKVIDYVTEKPVKRAIILHTNDLDLRDRMLEMFTTLHPDIPYVIYGLSPVLGVHLGNNGTGIYVQFVEE